MKTMLAKVTSKSFRIITVLGLLGLLSVAVPGVTTTAVAQQDGKVPGQSLGLNSDADLWRLIRNVNSGDTQIKSELAEVMIQPLHRAAMGCVGFNRRCLASHANKSSNQYPQNLPSPQDQRIQVWQKPLKAQPQRRNKVK